MTGLVALPATWLALERGGGITEVIAVETAMIAVNLMWTALLARRVARRLGPSEDGTTGATAELRRRFVRFAWGSTVLVGIQLVVWRRSELFALEWLSDGDQIARYSIAFALVWGLSRTVGGVAAVVAPAVASLVGSGALHRAGAGFWRMCRLLLVLGPAAAAATVALGPPLVRLAYGEPYADVGPVIVVMAVPLAVLPVLAAAEAALLGLGRVRFVVVSGVAAAVVDVGVAVALVPGLGAIGAAIANGAAQLVAGVPAVDRPPPRDGAGRCPPLRGRPQRDRRGWSPVARRSRWSPSTTVPAASPWRWPLGRRRGRWRSSSCGRCDPATSRGWSARHGPGRRPTAVERGAAVFSAVAAQRVPSCRRTRGAVLSRILASARSDQDCT